MIINIGSAEAFDKSDMELELVMRNNQNGMGDDPMSVLKPRTPLYLIVSAIVVWFLFVSGMSYAILDDPTTVWTKIVWPTFVDWWNLLQ